MTDTPDLRIDNSLLRAELWLTTRSLKNYHDAEHVKTDVDGIPMLQVTVSELTRSKAGEVIRRANERLRQA